MPKLEFTVIWPAIIEASLRGLITRLRTGKTPSNLFSSVLMSNITGISGANLALCSSRTYFRLIRGIFSSKMVNQLLKTKLAGGIPVRVAENWIGFVLK